MTVIDAFDLSVGAHRIRFESPDFLSIAFVGPFTVEQAQTVVQTTLDTSERIGPLLISVDVSRFQSSGPKIREVFAKGAQREYQIRAMAFWGASFPVRMAMMMVIRASRALKEDVFKFPMEFKATEEDARKWLLGMRSRVPAISV
jgi:hypothetical protein